MFTPKFGYVPSKQRNTAYHYKLESTNGSNSSHSSSLPLLQISYTKPDPTWYNGAG
jgi:hypothetical protein